MNTDKVNACVVSWQKRNPEKVAQYDRTKRGIKGAERFNALLAAQGGRCAICRTDTPAGRGWHADHDHATGYIRGVLCTHCNVGIGNLKDSPALLRAAAAYLESR